VTSSVELQDVCFDFFISYISYKSHENLLKPTKRVMMLLPIIYLVHLPRAFAYSSLESQLPY